VPGLPQAARPPRSGARCVRGTRTRVPRAIETASLGSLHRLKLEPTVEAESAINQKDLIRDRGPDCHQAEGASKRESYRRR